MLEEFYAAIKDTEKLLDKYNWKAPAVFKRHTGNYTISSCIIVPGEGDVEYEEEWELSFDLTPGENPSWEYPGHPAEVEFIDATLKIRTKFIGNKMESMKADRFMHADEWFEYSGKPEEDLRKGAFEHLGNMMEAAQETAQRGRRQ